MSHCKRRVVTWTCVCLAVVALFVEVNTAAADAKYLSPSILVADAEGENLYVAEATAGQVAVLDIGEVKVKKTYALPANPTGLALSPDGSNLYVTGDSLAGKVYVIDVRSSRIVKKLSVGHTPTAPVVSPDGTTLYVCNRFNNDVSVIDLTSNKQITRIGVTREPVAAAITPDGGTLLVANLLPTGPTDKDYAAAVVSIIDTAANKVAASVSLPNGSMALRGICISFDGRYAYVTHILARYLLPTTQLERGWMNTNALSIIDVENKKLINTVLLDNIDLGAANPWGVACMAGGKYIVVAHAGSHELSIIDRSAMHEKLEKVAAGEKVSEVSLSADDVPNDLSFLVGMRRRIKLSGNGPRGIAVVGDKVYAAEYFTDSIGVVKVDLDSDRPKVDSIALGPDQPLTQVRKGEKLFADATMCFQHWQSCTTCHPDSRTDALNWDLLNDGMGNAKNTRSMLLSHKTPPSMASGIRGNAEAAVRAGIRHIQFAVRPEEDAVAIDEYLKSLKPVSSPYLVGGWFGKRVLNKSAKRGRKLFKSADCSTCHKTLLYTDLNQYDVATGKRREAGNAFDTPTLVEVWRTAPYLHDGRAATMKDVLTAHNPGDKHGVTSNLTEKQIHDLAEFVLSQ